MVSTKIYNYGLVFSCLIGLGLSLYAYVVELSAEQDENYVAMCDISERMSCSKAFKSRYGRGFGIVPLVLGESSILNKPNSLLGMLFFSVIAALAQSNSIFVTRLSFFGILLSNVASLYFAYILYFVLNTFCVVCVSTYVVNFVNLVLVYYKLKQLKESARVDKLKKKK